MNSYHNLIIIIKKIMGTICSSSVLAENNLWAISWVQIFKHQSTCKVCPYLRLHPFTKVLSAVLPLMTSSRKNNLLFLMNNLNHKNMDEYINSRQETSNLPTVKLVDTHEINCLPLLIMTYYVDCQFTLIDWMNTEQCINWLSIAFFWYKLTKSSFLQNDLTPRYFFPYNLNSHYLFQDDVIA